MLHQRSARPRGGHQRGEQNLDAAKTFVTWMAGDEFASAYANALPGFFALTSHAIKVSRMQWPRGS